MERHKIDYCSADLQAVLAVIGKLIRNRPLAPELARSIPNTRGSIVAGHEVTIDYVQGKRAGPRAGRYAVTISGPRVKAGWRFRTFELEKLSRSVDRALEQPSQPSDEAGRIGGGRLRSADTNPRARMTGPADNADPPPRMAGTHYDDQAERYLGQAPEDFPRGAGLGGRVNLDKPPAEALSADPEMNIVPTDAKGG